MPWLATRFGESLGIWKVFLRKYEYKWEPSQLFYKHYYTNKICKENNDELINTMEKHFLPYS